MTDFNYKRTIHLNRAVYGSSAWDRFMLVILLLVLSVSCYGAALALNNDSSGTVPQITFLLLTFIAVILFFLYKRLTGNKLYRMETGMSQSDNHRFILHFIDSDEDYGLTTSEPEYIIMHQQGIGWFRPTMLTVLVFDGYILFNGQNIDRYGGRHPMLSGYHILRRELKDALRSFRAAS